MKKLILGLVSLIFGVIAFAQPTPVAPREATQAEVTAATSGTTYISPRRLGGGGFAIPLPLSSGGTGATTAGAARTNLGVGTGDTPSFAGTSTGSYQLTSSGINAQVGTTYQLLSTDNGRIITLSNGSAITLTVPASLGAGFTCVLIQLGAGQVTVAASGTTVNNLYGNTKLAGQYAQATLTAYVADTFIFSGDTAP